MTSAEARVIRAAVMLSSAAHGALSIEQVPSILVHELYDAVNALEKQIPTLAIPGINLPVDEPPAGETKVAISHDEKLVRFDLGKPIAWFAFPKDQCLPFAFAILEHCGVKVEMHDLTKGAPS